MEELSDQISNSYVVNLILGGMTALGSVVIYLWKTITEKTKKTEEKLVSCEESHKETTNKLVTMAEEFGVMKGKIEILSTTVLKKINESNTPNNE